MSALFCCMRWRGAVQEFWPAIGPALRTAVFETLAEANLVADRCFGIGRQRAALDKVFKRGKRPCRAGCNDGLRACRANLRQFLKVLQRGRVDVDQRGLACSRAGRRCSGGGRGCSRWCGGRCRARGCCDRRCRSGRRGCGRCGRRGARRRGGCRSSRRCCGRCRRCRARGLGRCLRLCRSGLRECGHRRKSQRQRRSCDEDFAKNHFKFSREPNVRA